MLLESSRHIILGDLFFRRSADGLLIQCVNDDEAHKLLQEVHGYVMDRQFFSFTLVACFLLKLLPLKL
jgi:hypothetical protein